MSDIMKELENIIAVSERKLEDLVSRFEALESVEVGLNKSRDGLNSAADSVSEAGRSIGQFSNDAREILGSLGEITKILKRADTGKLAEEVDSLSSKVEKTGASIEKLRNEFNHEIRKLKEHHSETTLTLIKSMKRAIMTVGFLAAVAAAVGFALGFLIR